MTLADLQQDMVSSMKKGDKLRVDALRFLIAAVRNQAIASYGADWETSISEKDILDVIKKQVKTHKESVVAFEKAGRTDLSAKENEELAILSAFLPSELTDNELDALLLPVVQSSDPSNFGLLMKSAMAAVAGRAGGDRVAPRLKALLSGVKQ